MPEYYLLAVFDAFPAVFEVCGGDASLIPEPTMRMFLEYVVAKHAGVAARPTEQ